MKFLWWIWPKHLTCWLLGKSVGLNAIVTSLLYKKHPAELKFVIIDPKKVEFSVYTPIEKHFLAKLPDSDDAIITDVNKVVMTLKSLCQEMDERYILLQRAGVRNIKEYNAKFINRKLNPEHHCYPTSYHQYHYWYHKGQLPCTCSIPSIGYDEQPCDSGPKWSPAAYWSW